MKPYHQILVKPGSSVELPCHVQSNLAQAVWTVNGNTLSEASRFHLLGEAGLLIFSMAPEDQGQYECWSLEWAGGKNFTRLVTGYVLNLYSVKKPSVPDPSTPLTSTSAHNPTTATEGKSSTAGPLLTSAPPSSANVMSPPQPVTSLTPGPSSTVALQKHSFPSSDVPHLETLDPATEYLQHDSGNALLFLFLLFFLLFLAVLSYNCYMQYLPAPCLKLRAALLGSSKKPQPEYLACEAGLMGESVAEKPEHTELHQQNGAQQRALRDTGYETEPECGNGKIPSLEYGDESPPKERPFDVDCESQPIEYADADVPY